MNQDLTVVRTIDAIHPDGVASTIEILLGVPYSKDKHFRCPMKIRGLDFGGNYPDIAGADRLQSIILAIALAQKMLLDYRKRGSQLFYPGTKDAFEPLDFFLRGDTPE